MKKVILNKTYGMFDVSDRAYRLYAEKKGIKLFRYKAKINYDDNNKMKITYVKSDDDYRYAFPKYTTEDLGDSCDYIPTECLLILDENSREDLTLIEVVEELGELANTVFSKLVIVEIPDDLDYTIDNYDGVEILHQKVREW